MLEQKAYTPALDQPIATTRHLETARMVAIAQIAPNPFQPRHSIDEGELAALKASIQQNGILQPLLVCPHEGQFVLVAGFRRLSAAKLAGLKEVPCTVREMTENEILRFALIENLQRNDLNPVEEGESIQRLITGERLTQAAAAQLINKSEGFVNERLALMKLPLELKSRVAKGQLPLRKGLEIGRLSNTESQLRLAGKAQRIGLEELQAIVQKKLEKEKAGRKQREKNPMQNTFREILADLPNVRIYKDRVSFAFASEQELISTLERLIQELKGEPFVGV